MILNIAHLSLGRWTLVTRILDIVVIVFGLNILLAIIFGPSVNAVHLTLDVVGNFGWLQVPPA
ncbi:MAG: hypothetical protein R2844_15465 [Caldilineales bacterium]